MFRAARKFQKKDNVVSKLVSAAREFLPLVYVLVY